MPVTEEELFTSAAEHFIAADTDGSEQLSVEELAVATGTTLEEATALHAEADTDGDGSVSLSEFMSSPAAGKAAALPRPVAPVRKPLNQPVQQQQQPQQQQPQPAATTAASRLESATSTTGLESTATATGLESTATATRLGSTTTDASVEPSPPNNALSSTNDSIRCDVPWMWHWA